MTIGDSWAWLVAAGALGGGPAAGGFDNSLGTVMSDSTGRAGLRRASLVVARPHKWLPFTLPAAFSIKLCHPDADWSGSPGGNDMLLGQLGGGFYGIDPNNAAVYAAIQANVQIIANAILADRPDLQVVIMGYDYLNIWDQGLWLSG